MKTDDFLSVGLANAERCNPGISSFDCVESDKNAVLKKVTVVNMPEDTLVLKLEHIGLEGIVRDKSIPKKWGIISIATMFLLRQTNVSSLK